MTLDIKNYFFLLALLATVCLGNLVDNNYINSNSPIETTYIATHIDIENHILKGDFSTASNKICEILSNTSSPNDNAELIVNRLAELSAELRKVAADSEANNCEIKILAFLSLNTTPCDMSNRVLKHAFLRGQFEMVIKSQDIADDSRDSAFSTFSFAHLRARAAKCSYFQYFDAVYKTGRWPTEKEAAELKRLAKLATRLYESALSKAPGSFGKTQLAAEWLELNRNCYYEADSEILRSVLPTSRPRIISEDGLFEQQIKNFEYAVEQAIKQGRDSSKVKPASLSQISRLFSLEYKRLFVTIVPQNIFDEIIGDLPLFFDMSMPIHYIKNEDYFGETMQWYLWNAIIRPLPDKIERKVIDDHVYTYGNMIESEFDRILSHPRLKPVGSEYKARWLNMYQRLKDNHFIPYFKRAMMNHQYEEATGRILKQWDNIAQNFHRRIEELDAKPDKVKTDEDYKRKQRLYAETLFIQVFTAISLWDRPTQIPLPTRIIYSCTGTLNNHHVYVFSVDGSKPFPPFPMKKWLTDPSSANKPDTFPQIRRSK